MSSEKYEEGLRSSLELLIFLWSSDTSKNQTSFYRDHKELFKTLRNNYKLRHITTLLLKRDILFTTPMRWNTMNKTMLQEAVVIRWVNGKYELVKEFIERNAPLAEFLRLNYKISIAQVLDKYGFKRRYSVYKGKTQKELEKMLVKAYLEFLENKETDFRKFRISKEKLINAIKRKDPQETATTVLEKYGVFKKYRLWWNKTGPQLEAVVIDLWNTGNYSSPTNLEESDKNGGLRVALRKFHFLTIRDAIVKSEVPYQYEWEPLFLDIIVREFIQKRMIEIETWEEVKWSVEKLSQRILIKHGCGYMASEVGMSMIMVRMRLYSNAVYRKLREGIGKTIKPPQ